MNGEEIKWPEGVKRTKQRESIAEILQKSDRPLNAAEICELAGKPTSGTSAWLSTVYRTLEVFVKKDFVIKTTLTNSGTALYELNRFRHKHYAVCVNCRKIIELEHCPIEHFDPRLEGGTFHVLGHKLEVFGVCESCGHHANS